MTQQSLDLNLSLDGKKVVSLLTDEEQWEAPEKGEEFYFDYGNFWATAFHEPQTLTTHKILGKVERVAAWGGEGDGASQSVVIKVGGRLFQMDGYYSSWDSDHWDGIAYEVEPYEKTVTRYKKK